MSFLVIRIPYAVQFTARNPLRRLAEIACYRMPDEFLLCCGERAESGSTDPKIDSLGITTVRMLLYRPVPLEMGASETVVFR